MSTYDYAPVTVMPYNSEALAMLIRQFAGSMQISEVMEKTQLQYIDKYLSNNSHTKAKTIVAESHYIDRHYIEDYSEYYARCFNEYPKGCSRIHFFSNKFDHHTFLEKLSSGEDDVFFNDDLQKSYLGYFVLRPIPHTFLGKLCFRPYNALVKEDRFCVRTVSNNVSLFGVPLTVQASPFVEKDEVVAKCASSAIWALLSAEANSGSYPSLSTITKAASDLAEGTKTFVSGNMSRAQIVKCLSKFGLQSSVVDVESNQSYEDVCELSFAYISNNTPLLIGGTVYEQSEDNNGIASPIGDHLVCSVGYRKKEMPDIGQGKFKLTSHLIDRIYVHDDRFGPYVSWKPCKLDIKSKVNGNYEVQSVDAWEYGLKDPDDNLDIDSKEYFVPDLIISATDHKVRLSYLEIVNSCRAFCEYLLEDLEQLKKRKQVKSSNEINKDIEVHENALNQNWSISLRDSGNYKSELRDIKGGIFVNGSLDRNAILLRSLPKHLWLCRLEGKSGIFLDMLFDATEVPQGNTFIGFVAHSEDSDHLITITEGLVSSRAWARYEADVYSKKYIRPFIVFFNEIPKRNVLNSRYGHLHTPLRGFNDFELDETKNISMRDKRVISQQSEWFESGNRLDISSKYIWVIDDLGNFVLGVEDPGHKQGHPTLVDGRPARLGGQLCYNKDKETWIVDLYSAAYSGHLKSGSDVYKDFLDNVRDDFLSQLEVECNYGDPNFNAPHPG